MKSGYNRIIVHKYIISIDRNVLFHLADTTLNQLTRVKNADAPSDANYAHQLMIFRIRAVLCCWCCARRESGGGGGAVSQFCAVW